MNFFQRVQVPYTLRLRSEVLASRKVVCRETFTEGNETAKSGTDEQERHMRLLNEDKQAHLCNVQSIQTSFDSRCRSDWRKELSEAISLAPLK